MTGLVLVAHADLAQEILSAAEMIVGPIEKAVAVSIDKDDPADLILDRIREAVQSVGGEGTIIMTDMFGGTPANVSLSFLQSDRIEVLTGMNLPMIIQFAFERSRSGISELASRLCSSGRESISVAGDFLKGQGSR
ncbi:MAG: PTS sugar transporter [Desulfuromonadia bacterium]